METSPQKEISQPKKQYSKRNIVIGIILILFPLIGIFINKAIMDTDLYRNNQDCQYYSGSDIMYTPSVKSVTCTYDNNFLGKGPIYLMAFSFFTSPIMITFGIILIFRKKRVNIEKRQKNKTIK